LTNGEVKMSNLTLWSAPFADFDSIVRRAFGPGNFGSVRPAFGFTPAAEVTREGSDAVVRLELPGVDASKDVVVEVVDGRLVVKGERRDERASSEHGRTIREVRYGSFRRAFALPAHVTGDAVTATYDVGVLTIRVAGAHAGVTGRRIAVTTGEPTADAVEPAPVEVPAESGEQPAA
jgi:HSP20 family protein